MSKEKAIDYERVALLLSIHERASAHGLRLDALAREAVAELAELNADARSNQSARAAAAA